ncbi:MAG TPA: PAS domain S-box protein [Burkholderiaceae bacterium]
MARDFSDDLSSLVGHELASAEHHALLEGQVRHRAVRLYFAASAAIFLSCAFVLWAIRRPGELMDGWPAVGLAALIGLTSLLSLWRLPRRFGARMVGLSMVMVMGLALVIAITRSFGLYSINLAMLSLMVTLGTCMLGLRMGLLLTALATAGLLGLAWGESQGLIGTNLVNRPISERMLAHLGLVAVGLLIGTSVLRMVKRAISEAFERNARFRELLAMAADAYWEMDREYRFTHVAEDKPGTLGLNPEERIGKTPWELAAFGLSDEELDAHRADLESHRPFHGLVTRHLEKDGTQHYVSISGEPRFDKDGNFRGYWGVARDVSGEVQAEQIMHASETRYRELFRRSPSPLVLHRWGRVIDANPAAMAMFGYTQRSSMVGQDLFSHYEPGDDERARQRNAKMEGMQIGALLPVAEFRLRTLARKRRNVSVTSVRVDAIEGPATLSFYLDQTEALHAQEALRRSETLLTHLVATSPDVITLTDMKTGRYAMVNKSFEQLMGYSTADVLGRSTEELNIWHDPQDRLRVLDGVRDHGKIDNLPITFLSKAGQPISMLMSAAPFVMDGQEYLVANARDVTESERQRMVQSAILANASIGITLTHNDHFVQINPLVEAMFGWPAGSLAGKAFNVLVPDPQAREELSREIDEPLRRGERIDIERHLQRRDGSSFVCRILARAVDPQNTVGGGTIWILEDVTERRSVEAALALAKDEAQAASRAKSAFLANTSHEIRTPLNGLLGLARMLQQPDLKDSTRREYLDQMLDSAESLSGLISDILDLSKIEAGRLSLETLPFALREMLNTIRLAYATLAQARGLTFTIEVDPAVPPRVMGDPTRVRQILSNYLGNALKFTEHGGVTLRVRSVGGDQIRIEVSDTGPGIAAHLQPQLFQPFTQADSSTTRRYGGTGLGLSICRELATLMSGQVGMESTSGQGATFWAELPLPATQAVMGPPPRSLPGPRPVQELEGQRVLMVEDHPVNMMIAVAQLEQWGLKVSQALDGRQAVAAIHAAADEGQPFDVVLMDVQMPVMGGHEATREVRKRFSASELPIIALTAAALVSEREEATAAGMNDFLTKPVDAPRLHQTLVRLIGRHNAQRVPNALPGEPDVHQPKRSAG